MAKAIFHNRDTFNKMTEEQLKQFLLGLATKIKWYPSPLPKEDMTPVMRFIHAMKKKKHEEYVRRLRKFLLKRHKAQVRKVPVRINKSLWPLANS